LCLFAARRLRAASTTCGVLLEIPGAKVLSSRGVRKNWQIELYVTMETGTTFGGALVKVAYANGSPYGLEIETNGNRRTLRP